MKAIFTFFTIIISITLNAQVTWNFATAAPTNGILANSTVSNLSQGNNNGTTTLITSSSVSTGYAGASGTQNAGAASFTGSLNTASSTYFEVTITPASGYNVSISNIALGSRSTATGPQLLSIRSSIDGYLTDATTATVSNNSAWALAPFSAFTLINGAINIPITLRIYGSNGAGTPAVNTANWRIDDLSISYAVSVAPITLKSFTAVKNTNNVLVKWATSQESNIKNYVVEKSTNGVVYNSIATVIANNATESNYQFTDVNVSKGSSLYRLKINGNDGKVSYSTVARVNSTDNNAKITVYPTISNSKITADFYAEKSSIVNVIIIDAVGKIIKQQNVTANSGNNNVPIAINTLANGVYRIRIVGENINSISSFIKN